MLKFKVFITAMAITMELGITAGLTTIPFNVTKLRSE